MGCCKGKLKVNRDVNGEIVLITGANTGIGYEAAKYLAREGAIIIIACRSPERGQEALQKLKTESGSDQIELMQLGLARMLCLKQQLSRDGGSTNSSRLKKYTPTTHKHLGQ